MNILSFRFSCQYILWIKHLLLLMHSLRVLGRVVAAGKSPVCWRWLAWSVHTGLLCLRATAIVGRNVNLITLLRKWRQEWVCSLHINCRYVLMKWTAGLFIATCNSPRSPHISLDYSNNSEPISRSSVSAVYSDAVMVWPPLVMPPRDNCHTSRCHEES